MQPLVRLCIAGFAIVRADMQRVIAGALLVAALLLSARLADAQRQAAPRTLVVSVRDSASRRPVVGASVSYASRATVEARTDSAGRATLTLAEGEPGTLVVEARGFEAHERPFARWTEDYLDVDVALRRAAQALSEVAVRANGGVAAPHDRLAEFERRLAMGKGRFIVREEIVKRGHGRTSDLFRGVAGLRVVDSASSRLIIAARAAQSSLVSRSANADCVVPIVLDGMLKEGSFQVDLLSPSEIHGVEIYTGIGSIPPEYSSMQRNAWCGLIVIWTRDR